MSPVIEQLVREAHWRLNRKIAQQARRAKEAIAARAAAEKQRFA